MRLLALVTVLLVGSLCVLGQDEELSVDDLVQSAEQWAKENLDDDTLRVLGSVDRDKVEQFFRDLDKQFRGQYVLDLAALKDTANAITPLLDASDETRPYAAWLKARLDYLDVADQFRTNLPPAKSIPGVPSPRATNPPPKLEREAWNNRLADRPWPRNADAYVPRLKPIFAAQKVPPQLVWVAEVESAFDPKARSPAGAVGLFQLMPATARQYGLRTWPLDQRLRPEENARAAAKYLQYLHSLFNDWELALAAYNAGEGTVQKLLDRNKARTFDAIATSLPAETQMYVPRVEATLARREGISLSQLRPPRG